MTPGLDSHTRLQLSGEVISDRGDSVYNFLHFLYDFVHPYFTTSRTNGNFRTLFVDKLYDPCVYPFFDGCSGDDIQAVRHMVSVCLIIYIE
jgi:hypothetical protein